MRIRLVVGAAALVIGVAGCSKPETKPETKTDAATAQAAQTAGQGAQSAAQGLQQMAAGLQQMATNMKNGQPAAKLIDSDDLKTMLPDVGGWERKDVKGSQASMGIVSYSHAEATYDKGDQNVKLEITDTAMSQIMTAPIAMFVAAGYSEKSDDGYKKAVTVGGQPGFEDWEKNNKHGEVTALVANRFIVSGTGNSVDSTDVVRKLVESVNMGKLAALK